MKKCRFKTIFRWKNDDYKLLYYGTKLYGYIDNDYDCPEKELKSYKYLLEIGIKKWPKIKK